MDHGRKLHTYWLGTFEPAKRILFEQTVKPGHVVDDIGANVGWYSLLASALVGKTGKVYAFEPLPENLHYLKRHLELNNIQNVEVVAAAVAEAPGTAAFSTGPNRSMGHLTARRGIPIPVVSLDDMVTKGQLREPSTV